MKFVTGLTAGTMLMASTLVQATPPGAWTLEKLPSGDYAALAGEKRRKPAFLAFQCYSDASKPGMPSDCGVFLNAPIPCSPDVHKFKVDVTYGDQEKEIVMWCLSHTPGVWYSPRGDVDVWAWGLELPLSEVNGLPAFDVKSLKIHISEKEALYFSTFRANKTIKKVLEKEFGEASSYKEKLAKTNSETSP